MSECGQLAVKWAVMDYPTIDLVSDIRCLWLSVHFVSCWEIDLRCGFVWMAMILNTQSIVIDIKSCHIIL